MLCVFLPENFFYERLIVWYYNRFQLLLGYTESILDQYNGKEHYRNSYSLRPVYTEKIVMKRETIS